MGASHRATGPRPRRRPSIVATPDVNAQALATGQAELNEVSAPAGEVEPEVALEGEDGLVGDVEDPEALTERDPKLPFWEEAGTDCLEIGVDGRGPLDPARLPELCPGVPRGRPPDPCWMPSVTTWTRLETSCRNPDAGPGLEAQLYDPLWALGRQWQVGEFAGTGRHPSPLVLRPLDRRLRACLDRSRDHPRAREPESKLAFDRSV